MSKNELYFMEWMEEFMSQERGSRVVHYLLKDSMGESVLAVVGTERSLRHMVYVVADEFLSHSCTDASIQAGFKWRSRREVVDWLTSMLSRQQQIEFPGVATRYFGSGAQRFAVADKLDHRGRNFKQSYSDIVWLGAPWTCGKQLKHFPSFCKSGTTISAQSFVFVMAKQENRYVAYLEDMYEDKKGQKKVKVRWFHHSQEVKGVVRLRNSHPKEVYITPYTQVISIECVDGPAIVLTREHFEKCIDSFPDGLLVKVHICFRQFRSNKIKPFDLRKLRGYFDQPLISCLDSDSFLNSDPGSKEFPGKGIKRTRTFDGHESFLTGDDGTEGLKQKKIMCAPPIRSGYSGMFVRKALSFKNVDIRRWHTHLFKVNDKIELLCHDSGIRGCWFRCTILEISRKQIKLEYDDLEDQDGCGNLKECVPAFRLAAADKLGMRCLERPAIRPSSLVTYTLDTKFEVGDPVDAWWSDGWWEGVVTAVDNGKNSAIQVYTPGENLFLNVSKGDLRISRDWVDGKWIDVEPNRYILSAIPPTSMPPPSSTAEKDDQAHIPLSKTKVVENDDREVALATSVCSADHPEQVSSSNKDGVDDHHVNEKSDCIRFQDNCCENDNDDETGDTGEKEDNLDTEFKRSSGLSEDADKGDKTEVEFVRVVALTKAVSSGDEDKEASTPGEEALQVTEEVVD